MDHTKTFGWNVMTTFKLPKGAVEDHNCLKEVLRALSSIPSAPPALYQEAIKLWDDWRDEVGDFADDPTPVEVEPCIWDTLNDIEPIK